MERILVLVNGSGPERATMEFACYIANLTHSRLIGLFLDAEPKNQTRASNIRGSKKEAVVNTVKLADRRKHLDDSKLSFQMFCDNHQLNCKPDVIELTNPEEIYLQSRFADLMIITADAEVVSEDEDIPSELATTVLKNAECPVFIAPLTFKEMNEIVFTYDGSPSSVFAIKQFTHLFPNLSELPVTFLEVNKDGSGDIRYKESITEYLADHYKYVNEMVLRGRPENELFSYFLEKKEVIVVMGSFGRMLISSIFHRSTATLLLKTTSLPVFISHQ
ncbi:MAG: universal stress protein [Chitinophagaceae bacterium]|nr:universal stress protein [Chitinophagaceae bacterium]